MSTLGKNYHDILQHRARPGYQVVPNDNLESRLVALSLYEILSPSSNPSTPFHSTIDLPQNPKERAPSTPQTGGGCYALLRVAAALTSCTRNRRGERVVLPLEMT